MASQLSSAQTLGLDGEEVAHIQTKLLAAHELHVAANLLPAQRNLTAKRVLDLLISIPLLLLTLPLYPLILLAIHLDSSGPALFRQVRIGKDGQPFLLYKFRSMFHQQVAREDPIYHQIVHHWMAGIPLDTPNPTFQNIPQHASARQTDGEYDKERAESNRQQTGSHSYKLKNDPRITRVGRFLRKTSLDEIPQLFNVVRGQMALVGPRPAIPYEVERYSERALARLYVKPGLTGLWQVNGRGRVKFQEAIEIDLVYIMNNSLWGDVLILLRTIPAILRRAGAA